MILDVAISTVAVVTTQLALQREAHGGVVGVMGAGLNIVMYFSPLSAMVSFAKSELAIINFQSSIISHYITFWKMFIST